MAKEFMGKDFLLNSEAAVRMYEAAEKMPIFDWHCHLSPKEIYENKEPADIAELWLGGDHYKWRVMRSCGIEEKYITGKDTIGYEKFKAFASCMPSLIGNPMYHWCHLELRRYFGIEDILNAESADAIWEKANAAIKAGGFTPRELIAKSNVACVCTTDDPADSLEYHKIIAADSTFGTKVVPSFRPDKALLFTAPGYPEYMKKLETSAGIAVDSLDALCAALEARAAYFKANGCIYTDVGIADFPRRVAGKKEAAETFASVLSGKSVTDAEKDGLLGYLFVFLGGLYRKYNFVMQWHLGAVRNPNSALYAKLGPDCGCDCVGLPIDTDAVLRVLDAIESAGGLPRTVLYSLNKSSVDALCSVAGSFRGVSIGAAWWFNDHRQGILDALGSIASVGHLGSFRGMLTDSRSFLSYVRHDYFRRLLAEFLAEQYATGECADEETLLALMKRISYENIQRETEENI